MIASTDRVQSHSADPVLNDIIDKLTARMQARQDVDIDQCVAAHPEYAEQLRRLIPALQVLAELPQSVDSDMADPSANIDPDRTAEHIEPGVSVRGTLGDFRIVREIGRGGMGLVYEAEQISLNRRVALKVLPFAATMDSRQLQRFRHEAQAAAMLHHRNIVPVFGVGNERGVHYYAMQLIGGQSLAQYLAALRGDFKEGPASLPADDVSTPPVAAMSTLPGQRDKAHYRRIAELMALAADALDYAHSMGVVHRDVKPGNLLLDDSGHLWVTDFGLAKLDSGAGMTITGDLVGTLRYMSPEQALAKRGLVDERTDVYSLGATLYELLTLKRAIDGADKHEVLRNIAFTEPVPPRNLVSTIPAELETITLKCLAKEPSERYVSAAALAEDLRRFIDDRPVVARRATRFEKTWRWARRNPSVASLTAVVFLSLACGLATTMWQWHRAEVNAEKYRLAALAADRESTLSWRAVRGTLQGLAATSTQHSATDVRRQIYLHISKLNDELAANPSPARKFDRALIALGLGQSRINLGNVAAGSKDLLTGLELIDQLVQEQPDNQEYREQLAIALRANAIAMRKSNSEQAEALAQRAVSELRKMVAISPTPARQFDLAVTLRLWVQTLETLNRPNDELREESNELCRQLISENPASVNVDVPLELAANYREDSSRMLNRGNFKAGLGMAQQAMKVTDHLLSRHPERTEVISSAAQSCGYVASAYYRLKDWPMAVEHYQRAVALNRELVKLDPTNIVFENNLNFELSALALGLGNMQKYDEAHRLLDEAIPGQKKLLAIHKDREAFRRTQYRLLRNRSRLYGMAERHRESVAAAADLAQFDFDSGINAADAALFVLQNVDAIAKDATLSPEARIALTNDYKRKALEYTQLADRSGYSDAARLRTPFFEALHDNPEFQGLVKKIAQRRTSSEAERHE